MSNFVVTNAQETQDAVNFLLTTKAPGVISLSSAKKSTTGEVYFTPNGDQPLQDTYYFLEGFGLETSIFLPTQKILVSFGITGWVEWDPGTAAGDMTIFYEILRTDTQLGVTDYNNPVLSYVEFIPDLTTWPTPGQKFTILNAANAIDEPNAVGVFQYDIAVYIETSDPGVVLTFNYAKDITFSILQVAG
jgi:hypothetical protein